MLSLLAATAADFTFVLLRQIKPFPLSGAVVTGLIIGLLTSPNLPWHIPVLAALAAMVYKNFLRFSGKHIFNPAASGLLTASLIFQQPISWWAVSFQQFTPLNLLSLIAFLALLTPGWISIKIMRRGLTVVSFLFVYLIFSLIRSFTLKLNLLLDPTTIFFSLVMLPEPMTTPSLRREQIVFGLLVGLAASLLPLPGDPLIFALLLANLGYFVYKRFTVPQGP